MKTWDEITARRRLEPDYDDRVAAEKRDALREIHAFNLAELRRVAEFTQQELALRMGSDQSRVSRVERESDMHLSTLRAYVEALGGELHLTAEIPGQDPLPLAI
jgi:hypothetical protein